VDTASLETGAGAKAANNNVDDLSDVIRSLDKKAQGEYSLRLLLAAPSLEQLRNTVPSVHRIFVAARAQVMEETLGNLSAFYAMFPRQSQVPTSSGCGWQRIIMPGSPLCLLRTSAIPIRKTWTAST